MAPADGCTPDLAASGPRKIWVELTSTCPFDCVFCSRKRQRGHGQHMSFALYESLLRQLERPEVIRLNYSGESVHYPRLADAIRLARRAGATVELVSALASAGHASLEVLVDAGLHRLAVSLHSLEAAQFPVIYGGAELSDLRNRLEYLLRYRAGRGSRFPEVEFAFVAMRENLPQLDRVAAYAGGLGITRISVHPVIRRGPAPGRFEEELDAAGDLRPEFAAAVRRAAEAASQRHHGVAVHVARPDRAGPPAPGGITTCEQNPWETAHVLADGRVVVCEVQDQVEIGHLLRQSLAEIWTGEPYREFRRRYLAGTHPACAACPWRSTVQGPALVRGWHPRSGESVHWSEASAAAAVPVAAGAAGIRVAGLLPAGAPGANSLEIRNGSAAPVRVVNDQPGLLPFHTVVPAPGEATAVLRFEVGQRFCPADRGSGPDLRQLGFALTELRLDYGTRREEQVRRFLALLRRVERLAGVPPALRPRPARPAPLPAGISVVVPARGDSEWLPPTLEAAQAALAGLGEPAELIVVLSQAAGFERAFPRVRWLRQERPLGYLAAVERGLSRARYGWVYLLNSDMCLRPGALAELLPLRRCDTFAVGSRIVMRDGSLTETNWTELRYPDGDAAELVERDPGDLREAHGCLYVGGGSGLFRADLLRRLVRRTRAYAPFYWEDVEWGAWAWRHGYACLFCPTSTAVHDGRRTIARYYQETEVARIFERNRLLFHLRNLGGLERLEKRLLSLDPRSWSEISRLDTLRARAAAFLAPIGEAALAERWKLT